MMAIETNDAPDRVWLAIVHTGRGPLTPTQAAAIQQAGSRATPGRCHLAFLLKEAGTVALYLRGRVFSEQVRGALEAVTQLGTGGFVLVHEIGPAFAAAGNSAGWRHAQSLLRGAGGG
jgi:hypothetical protein